MVSSTDALAFDLLDFSSELNHDFLNSDITEIGNSNPDDPVQAPNHEDRPFDGRSAENELGPRDETGNLTSLLAQGNPLGSDSSRVYGNGDGASLDTWYEALSTGIDPLPKLQADNFILDLARDPRAAEWILPLEEALTEIPSPIAVSITPESSYLPTPDLTECSTPASRFTPNGSRDPTLRNTGSFDTENQRWHATLSRSRTADRYFLYGVLTTKIYCRPSCASRRPSRRHVRFFSFPGAIEAAEQAKFRPCKRCKPETRGTGNTAVLAISQVLRRIIAETFEEQNEGVKEGLKLDTLAKSAGLSTFHFHRLFKATTQVTPADFITACLALALQDNLRAHSAQATRSDPCDVHLPPRWSQRAARKALGGLNPEDYADGAKSASIEYCHVSSPVGDLEVAYSRDKISSNVTVHGVVLLHEFNLPISDHFGISKKSEEHAQCLQECVRELEEKCQDRDIELASDVLSVLWRVRLWLKLTHDSGLQWSAHGFTAGLGQSSQPV